MMLSAHVMPVMALIASTAIAKLPPEIKPDLGCGYADLRSSQSQSDWRSQNQSEPISGADQVIDGVCQLQIVPLRKTGRLKLIS